MERQGTLRTAECRFFSGNIRGDGVLYLRYYICGGNTLEPCLVKTRNRKAIVAKVFLFFVLILIPAIFLAGCSTDQDKPAFPDQAEPQVSESTPVTDLPSENQDTSVSDVVLVSHEANVGNRRLTITAMGLERQDGIDGCGIKTLNIFEGSDLIQTINISEAIERDGVSGAIGYGYTEAWDKESSFYTQDINFDGYEDLVVMGWIPNNTIPYYCYLWNADLEQYEYAFMLQGISIDTDNMEIISEYRYSGENYEYRYDHYRFNDDGELVLVDRVVNTQ